jgi:hypothetical protein
MSEITAMEVNNIPIKLELDTQIATAKMYPRNVATCIKKAIELVQLDQEIAESCIYALPRKKKIRDKNNDYTEHTTYIKGESVRLAEIVASTWGNIQCQARILGNDGRAVTVEAGAWDMENNVKMSAQAMRSILSSTGQTYSHDMQLVTIQAAQAIAKRNAIFSVIPKALVKRVYDAAVKTAVGDQKKLEQRIALLFVKFEKMGISPKKILDYFGKEEAKQITADEVAEMIGIGTAIKEGSLLIDKAFVIEAEIDTCKTDELESKLKAK